MKDTSPVQASSFIQFCLCVVGEINECRYYNRTELANNNNGADGDGGDGGDGGNDGADGDTGRLWPTVAAATCST